MMIETVAAVDMAKLISELLFRGTKDRADESSKAKGTVLDAEQQKREAVGKLLASGIDPLVFDALLSNEIDRKLKIRFGLTFVVLTVLFTSVSYLIIVLNGQLKLGISDLAMTGLIIETPIQFVGLLYIIARNLFPSGAHATDVARKAEKKSRKAGKKAAAQAKVEEAKP